MYRDYPSELNKEINKKNLDILKLEEKVGLLKFKLSESEEQLKTVTNSKGWKTLEKLRHIKRKLEIWKK